MIVLKTQGINLVNTRKVISINSWEKSKHLFARDLNTRELKLIDNFYQQCNLLNFELEESYNLPNHSKEKAKLIIKKHADFSASSTTIEEYEKKKQTLTFFEKDTYCYQADAPKENMIKRIQSIQNISSTTAINKLKEISEK